MKEVKVKYYVNGRLLEANIKMETEGFTEDDLVNQLVASINSKNLSNVKASKVKKPVKKLRLKLK